jgi:hypothetical protein
MAVSFYFAFQSGCAGDLKTGIGNPSRALQLEENAVAWFAANMVCATIAVSLRSVGDAIQRIVETGVFIVVAGGCWYFWFMYVVVRGVRACLGEP